MNALSSLLRKIRRYQDRIERAAHDMALSIRVVPRERIIRSRPCCESAWDEGVFLFG